MQTAMNMKSITGMCMYGANSPVWATVRYFVDIYIQISEVGLCQQVSGAVSVLL